MAPLAEETYLKATLGLRYAVVGINTLLIITGSLLISVGAHINQHLEVAEATSPELPRLWCMGIMPIAVAVLGIAVILCKNRKMVVLWVACSLLLVFGNYVFYILSGCLDPTRYGVHMQIFGDCLQDGTLCRCYWSHGVYRGVLQFSSCENIRHTTSLYLGLVALLVLCLTAVIISCILGAVVGCCVHICIPREEDETLQLNTNIYGVNLKPPVSAVSQSVYLPQYLLTPPDNGMYHESSVSV